MSETRSYLDQSPEVKDRLDRMKAREVILQVQGLSKKFQTGKSEVLALDDISFKTHRREFLCIIGPSGCGKSTLVRILAGLDVASGGQVLLDGHPVKGPGRERGMVFQGYTLFPWLTVRKNVMFGLRMNGVGRADAMTQANEWLALIGLQKFADAYPNQLSGGNEAARCDCPRIGEPAAHFADGRAVLGPGCADPGPHAILPAGDMEEGGRHGCVHHARSG